MMIMIFLIIILLFVIAAACLLIFKINELDMKVRDAGVFVRGNIKELHTSFHNVQKALESANEKLAPKEKDDNFKMTMILKLAAMLFLLVFKKKKVK